MRYKSKIDWDVWDISKYKLSAENSLRIIHPRGLNKVLKKSGKVAEYIKQLVSTPVEML